MSVPNGNIHGFTVYKSSDNFRNICISFLINREPRLSGVHWNEEQKFLFLWAQHPLLNQI